MDCHEVIYCDCGVANVVSLPDPEGDCTSYSGCAPAYKCWSCNKISWRGDPDEQGFQDCIDSWDPDLSAEKFLDFDCSINPEITWRVSSFNACFSSTPQRAFGAKNAPNALRSSRNSLTPLTPSLIPWGYSRKRLPRASINSQIKKSRSNWIAASSILPAETKMAAPNPSASIGMTISGPSKMSSITNVNRGVCDDCTSDYYDEIVEKYRVVNF